MLRKSASLTVVLLLCGLCPASGGNKPALRMHLPRAVRARGAALNLGLIGVIRSSDAKILKKASDIPMGRMPFSGEKITFDRRTILSRLATAGINPSMIRITGAEKVLVMLDETTFKAARLVRSADAFLKKTRPGPAGCSWRLVRQPGDMKVPTEENIQLKPCLGKAATKGYVTVVVAAVGGKRELGRAKMLFRLVYPMRQAVAIKDITSGEIFTQKNTVVRVVSVDRRPTGDWISPFGLIAARDIPAGKAIRSGLMKAKRPIIVVRRKQAVQMKVVGLGFVVTGIGQALSDGRVGDLIKVRNIDSKRVVTARVAFDGTVRPIYGKR